MKSEIQLVNERRVTVPDIREGEYGYLRITVKRNRYHREDEFTTDTLDMTLKNPILEAVAARLRPRFYTFQAFDTLRVVSRGDGNGGHWWLPNAVMVGAVHYAEGSWTLVRSIPSYN